MIRLRRITLALALTGLCALDPPVASADPVLDWNIIALRTTAAAAAFNPPLETRNLAIVHAAIFDAVNAIAGEFQSYCATVRAPAGASADAAAIAAAHATLLQLYPGQRPMLDASYSASLHLIPDGRARASGVAVGEAAAAQILRLRASDGAADAIAAAYSPGTRPGDWTPTPPAFLAALDPGWGFVRPFVLRRGSQFRPQPTPALDSRRYTHDVEEIKEIGSIDSATRTQDQTDLARFWVATAPQNWNPVARQAAQERGLTLVQTARALALLNLAGADAFIAAWDAKFAYHQWRPVTAIRAAENDGNPATDADPLWTPLLITPPFPDYIAGHTTYAGAAARVLEHLFGRDPGMVMTLSSATAPGVTQTYSTFAEIADGVVDARVLGGIHWRTSSVRGRVVGEAIGRYAVRHALEPREGRHREGGRGR